MKIPKDVLKGLVGPLIELPTPQGSIDLHNFADFERMVFSSNGDLQLCWVEHEPGRLKMGYKAIHRAILLFHDVTNITVSGGDPEIPRDENKTLEHFIVEEANEESCRFRFVFGRGTEMIVAGRMLSVEIEL
jgi:hypothetical protein